MTDQEQPQMPRPDMLEALTARDQEWAKAIAGALPEGAPWQVPVKPSAAAFQSLFNEIRRRDRATKESK